MVRSEKRFEKRGLNWVANYMWGIADDVLLDLYVRGKYRDLILPRTVLRRLDAVLEGSKQKDIQHDILSLESELQTLLSKLFGSMNELETIRQSQRVENVIEKVNLKPVKSSLR